MAGPHSTACVAATWISLAPCSCSTLAAPRIEPAVLIMSSNIRATLPFDRAADDVGLHGGVGARAALVDDRQRAADALGVAQGPLDAPFVGADDHDVRRRSMPEFRKCSLSTGAAYRWSTGTSKKP